MRGVLLGVFLLGSQVAPGQNPPPLPVAPPPAAVGKEKAVVSKKAVPQQMPAAKPGPKKAGPTSPPSLDVPAEFKGYATFRVSNLPEETGVEWIFPAALKTEEDNCVCEVDPATGEKIERPYEAAYRVSGPPGEYKVVAKLFRYNVKTKRPVVTTLPVKTFKILSFGPTPPVPDPKDDDDKKDPIDPPTPGGKITAFVIVEDTAKAGSWRGDLLGSQKVAAAYKAKGLKHRILSIGAKDLAEAILDPLAKKFIGEAVGKDLPWFFGLDATGAVVKSEKMALTEDAFVAQFTGGESEFVRRMGNIPPPEGKTRVVFAKFASNPDVTIIPRAQWKQVDLGVFLPKVYDQDGIGACNAFSTVTIFEAARAQAGLPFVELSRGYLYGSINGGSDQGSYLEDALEWMQKIGTVKVGTVGHLEWRKGRSLMNNAAAREEAKFYRIIEAYECPTFDAIASALQQGFFINEGLAWYNNYTPDRDGWLPTRGSGGMGGHALAGYGLAQRNGVWGIRTRNSWSASWGVGGNCIIPETCFDSRVGGYWAVRAVVQTPDGWRFSHLREAERHDRLVGAFWKPTHPLAF